MSRHLQSRKLVRDDGIHGWTSQAQLQAAALSFSNSTGKSGSFAAKECNDLFPEDLLSESFGIREQAESRESKWWLAHTLPRQEKALACALFAKRIGFYLPLVNRRSQVRGRTRTVQTPLFPSYIFVSGSVEDRLRALRTNRIVTISEVPDPDSLRRQLRVFAELIAAGAPLIRESRLTVGERVRITTGPFRDVEGTILRRNGKTELLVAVDFLGQGASLEIGDYLAEPI